MDINSTKKTIHEETSSVSETVIKELLRLKEKLKEKLHSLNPPIKIRNFSV